MTQLKSSAQAVVRDSHKSSLIFSFHAEVWSPKEVKSGKRLCFDSAGISAHAHRGLAQLVVQKGQALTCLQVSEHCSLPPHPLLLASLMLTV